MTTINLAELSVAEKLQLMEALWDSLSARANESLDSPAWHRAGYAFYERQQAGVGDYFRA